MWAILTDPAKVGNRWRAEEFFDTGRAEIDDLMKHVDSLGLRLPKRRALDFGCGIGRLTQALAQHFEEVDGVDVAASMIELARRYNRHGARCRYHVNPTTSLSLFTDGFFQFIYSSLTLQHMQPKYTREYLKGFVRVLAPGGLLVFQLPSAPISRIRTNLKRAAARTLLGVFRRVGYIGRPIMVMYGIDRQQVVRLLEENGARIVEVYQDKGAGADWLSFRYCATKP